MAAARHTILGENFLFNLLCHFGQRGCAVRRGKFNAVEFRRIVRRSEVDGAVGFFLDHRIRNRRCGSRFGDYEWGNAIIRQNL